MTAVKAPHSLTEQERLERAVGSLRNFLRDKATNNRLFGGALESTDLELKEALIGALMDWNVTPPPIASVTLATHPNKMLLIQSAAVFSIRSSALYHAREHMPSSDGGTSADDHAKFPEYFALVQQMASEVEEKRGAIKLAQNIADSLGSMGCRSEYGYYWVYGYEW